MAQAPSADDAVMRGREAHLRRAWRDAYQHLSDADRREALDAEDLDRLATAAHLIGHRETADATWERAHHAFLDRGEKAPAVRCAFWLGLTLLLRGEHARGGGWLARARHILEDGELDCVEQGYLRLPAALQALGGGDAESAYRTFVEITETADRFGDADLEALGRLGQGQSLVAQGRAAQGMAMLDEAMVAVTTGEVSAVAAGIVYCAMILTCRQMFDVRRVQEWTAALSRWCATQQGLKPFRGQCLVHRSEIMTLRGEWADALEEVRQACAHLSDPPDPVLGMALYQQAELLRLRGEFVRAEECYREASTRGHPVQPGLALLRLAQGRLEDAVAAIQRTVLEAEGVVERSRVLSAYVEITLAAGANEDARMAVAELDDVVAAFDTPYLRAVVGYARGCVLLADGDAGRANRALRRAWVAWHELDAVYETARVRLQVARACRQLGDHDTAELELDAARRIFEQLGAAPALDQVRALTGRAAPSGACGLTPREIEVLRLVATGATNRDIADDLVISDRTVARHVSNMFAKLGVSSRAAATAFAYEHDLV
ncbi:LuxR C-terminal-related transcriptional regulator [Pseudonocardia sp. DSM 110487]|uniref:LuxR family transcriptional regulator n=1 Tax=Pseudonocardia sp. DSM 110487 TaxID=2865833 RepID=UPI001C6A4E10|nr:LuxR family transcriptional regulator [Pseudonocardia sp. DSM 110487]QYN37734.1 LuxR C-terminal-related transcriptional regulator [Pseudonocardia sp. DSM 110487]